MLIQCGFKYRLNPTSEQRNKLLQFGGNARFLWNYLLAQNQEYYKATKKFRFFYDMAMSLPQVKEEYSFLRDSWSQSLQMVAKNLDRALKDSFKKQKGFPRFKKKSLLIDRFTCPQGWKLRKKSVYVPKIGIIKLSKHRPLQGKPKSITVSQDGLNWFCSILCEFEVSDRTKRFNNIVGVDVGLKKFATLSDGTVFENPKYLRQHEAKLIKEQRRLSKKTKGSCNRFKQRLKVRKIHSKIKNARQDFLHKTSNSIAKSFDGVVVEDLNIKGMLKNHRLAKSISDVSWSEFLRQLDYKCLWGFKHFIKIDRFDPTSKTCSKCGNIQDMPLSKRVFDCFNCGFSIDRDLNASINIKAFGLRNTVGHTGFEACGDEALVSSVKQEKEYLVNQVEALQV